MTKNLKIGKTKTGEAEPKKKLTRKEKEEAFRLMNENWSKGMDLYLAGLERQQKEEDASQ